MVIEGKARRFLRTARENPYLQFLTVPDLAIEACVGGGADPQT